MGPITRTCSLSLTLALLGLSLASPAAAAPDVGRVNFLRSGASTFLFARAAAGAGDARRAAILYASLAAADPNDRGIAARALGQAILAGDMPLALRLTARQRPDELAVDSRLLLAADALRAGKGEAAFGTAWPRELGFLQPFIRAWAHGERRRWREAVAILDTVRPDDTLAQVVPEHKALILLAAGKADLAAPLIPAALREAGGRGDRLRIAFAAGLTRAGRAGEAQALLAGRDVTLRHAAVWLASDRRPRLPIATAAEGYAELLTGLAITLNGNDGRSLPLGIAQVARFADPRNEETAVLLGLLLERAERADDALAVFRSVPQDSPFQSEARDAEIRTLLRADRQAEAIARAQAFAQAGDRVTADDWSRLGDVFDAANRHAEAADAFARSLALVEEGGPGSDPWSIHLLRGASLEQAGRWADAKQALEAAHKLAPNNPVVLNYLGYARLERGEQLDEAEAMIAEASRRAPDDASITDSLGWAQFKRGRVDQAIATLQRAAASDPAQSEINEHLGDALYTAGRRYEARFAWNAALVTAESDVRTRVEAKIAAGLTPATAAP
ncbi:tetratricopeptide repeat protein [Sphingomonas sp. LHG3406-1]|uniref:tetratricopeptide repeat protein n=1 Tax=Sphingomonas sp. LHG3406-1 TaxID=2804617 RepID=UPI002638571C|nr:tetratricopeptide repeat protein [Sphingomonas sp. LHG3406-1]